MMLFRTDYLKTSASQKGEREEITFSKTIHLIHSANEQRRNTIDLCPGHRTKNKYIRPISEYASLNQSAVSVDTKDTAKQSTLRIDEGNETEQCLNTNTAPSTYPKIPKCPEHQTNIHNQHLLTPIPSKPQSDKIGTALLIPQ